ncbi:MAG: tetratricopeptide repeat protein [Planctomycetales bacterium]|nr:tetratricopeptide repeat protein [Planctomycetales bacterium]
MAHEPVSATHAPEASATKPSLVGRILAPLLIVRKQPVRAALVGLPVAIIGGLVLWYSLFSGKSAEKATLELALAKLEAHENAEARRIAAEVRTGKDESFTNVGGAFFVLGAVMAEDAKEHENAHERLTLHLIASRYLEESRIRGFPAGHEKEGLLLLGRSLHHGGRFQASIPILKEALAHNPAAKGEILYLLADGYLHVTPPNLEQASTQARRLLAEKHLPQGERDSGLLLQGKIALAQGKFADGRKALEKISPKSSVHTAGALLSVRLLCERLWAAKGNPSAEDQAALEKTLKILADLGKQSRVSTEAQSQAELLTALCLELLGRAPEAIAQYAQVRNTRFGSPEAVAAAFYQGEFLLRSGNIEESVSLYKKGLTEAGPAETYHNDWLPRQILEDRLQQAIGKLLAANHFAEAEELAASLTPLFSEELAYFWRAKAEHEWGTHLRMSTGKGHAPASTHADHDAKAQHITPTSHAPQSSEHQAREHFRKAGSHFERLAKMRIATIYYLDDLMDSARDYLAGQSYSQAIQVLRAFLKEIPNSGQEEALVGLGEALLAVGESKEGLEILEGEIAAYPRHPATYRARLLASLGYEELGNVAQARKQLIDNLYNFSLTPESNEWRDSIFLLGRLVYHEALAHEAKSRELGVDLTIPEFRKPGLKELELAEGLFQEAARILEEAVERYPSAPQTMEARYFLADTHRLAARWPRKRLEGTAIEATRGTLTLEMKAELAAALREYALLIEKLGAVRDGTASETERDILRNSYFARADVLFDEGKFSEALAAYSAATSRYQHEPEALEAYVQIAACYRRLGRSAEARGTLEQARVVLTRMKPETNFTKTTPYSREEWTRLLTWLSAL